jgi:hypothetical protein
LKKGHYTVERKASQGDAATGFVPLRNVPGAEGELDQRITIEFHQPEDGPPADPNEQPVQAQAEEPTVPPDQRNQILFYPDGTAQPIEIRLRDREGFRLRLRMNPTTARLQILEKDKL